jgi:hypothetical protein
MNKHTQGIWKGRESITDARGRLIAVVHYSAFDSKNGISLEEGYANAALICAAPEMLAALKLVYARSTAYRTEDAVQLTQETLDAITKAIAKAEGSSK